tara:strand:+ start:1096 stop:1539 length:444 start_codon:yes stop_codon:yes gene_type:complete
MRKSNRYNQGIPVMSREKCRKIISIVNEFYEVNCLQPSRKREIVSVRQVAIYYTHKLTNLTSSSIGLLFNKDHATVLHCINIVEGRMLYDKEFKKERPKLEELIFGVNFKTTDEFLLFKAKEEINELMSKMSLDQCNELIENIKNKN